MPLTTRRSLLAAGALLLAGCSPEAETAAAPGDEAAEKRLRKRSAADSADLVARYDAAIAVHPPLAAQLKPLRAAHARHVKALGGAPGSSPTTPTGVPDKEKDTLKELAEAERRVTERREKDLVEASGEYARLLASVAAAGAAHGYLLTEGT